MAEGRGKVGGIKEGRNLSGSAFTVGK